MMHGTADDVGALARRAGRRRGRPGPAGPASAGRRRWILRLAGVGVFLVVVCLSAADVALAERVDEGSPPLIAKGAVEVGIAGALTTVEGIQTGVVGAHTGMFRTLWGGVGSAEVGLGYSHVSDLDQFDLEGLLTWGKRWGTSGTYPFASVGAGWRHEEIGSFGQSRYPVGLGLGVRSLLGRLAGFRFEYRFRRILNDPVSDFSEHRFTIGLSVYLRNSPKTKSGDK